MKRSKWELLAPAGSWEALEAAVTAGADAVYLSGKAFGARAFANNFERDELAAAVRFCHLHQVRIFVTVNTLADDSELSVLADYLVFLYNIGVDAIIVQDVGVVRLARKVVPALPLHASTQMNITNSGGVVFAKSIGCERVVVARELSLEELRTASSRGTEIETFIHGALCVCYSGQCLMSSLIGGRSGNRGACAQPCRLPYGLVNKEGQEMLTGKDAGQYLLSPKDFNTLSILSELLDTGVVSLKIEGRMKRPEYVAVVTDIYRRALDGWAMGNYVVPPEDEANIRQIFNRDFTFAYLEQRPGQTMISDRRPNNRGVLVGRITKLDFQRRLADGSCLAQVKLEQPLQLGDGLEFWVTVGGRTGLILKEMKLGGKSVISAGAGEVVTMAVPKGVRQNDRVFRTLDNALIKYAGQFFGEKRRRTIGVTARVYAFIGQPLRVDLTDEDGNNGIGIADYQVELARKRPTDEATVLKQIDRLGTTEYFLQSWEYDHDGQVMVPASELNEARRRAVEDLNRQRLVRFASERVQVTSYSLPLVHEENWISDKLLLTVHCDTLEKVQLALQGGADRILFGGDLFSNKVCHKKTYLQVHEAIRAAGKELAFGTPRIIKEAQLGYYEELFAFWQELVPDYVYINNNGLVPLMKKYPRLKYWADHSLNIFNSQSLQFWKEQGMSGASLSRELTMVQIGALGEKQILPLECLVQGRIEMMVSEYCVAGAFLGEIAKGACTFKCREKLWLKDRQEARFPLAMDQNCRMHVLNSVDLSLTANMGQLSGTGISSVLVDGRTYDGEELLKLVKLYRAVMDGKVVPEDNLPKTTRGHYFRGVL